MKNTALWVGFVLLLILNIVLLLKLSHTNQRIETLRNDREAPARHQQEHHGAKGGHHHEEEEIELAVVMSHLQRHANKLYFAGQNANWPLAGFYVHELEEAMEEVADGHIEDEGVNISKLMEAMGLPPLEVLEESIEAKDPKQFESAYLNLVNNCNACHQGSKHAYIVITTPKTPALDNQVFEVQP